MVFEPLPDRQYDDWRKIVDVDFVDDDVVVGLDARNVVLELLDGRLQREAIPLQKAPMSR